jgi:hypothetical protein
MRVARQARNEALYRLRRKRKEKVAAALLKSNPMDYNMPMNTVVELPEFIRRADKLLRDAEREELIQHLAANPKAGILLEGTGGIRKLRWKREGTGKSGGVRVIYYFHNELYPLFLLTLFGKSEKENISKAERNMLANLTEELLAAYQK